MKACLATPKVGGLPGVKTEKCRKVLGKMGLFCKKRFCTPLDPLLCGPTIRSQHALRAVYSFLEDTAAPSAHILVKKLLRNAKKPLFFLETSEVSDFLW